MSRQSSMAYCFKTDTKIRSLTLRQKIYSVFIVLLPIANQYEICPLQLMDICAMFGILEYILHKRGRVKMDSRIVLLLLYIVTGTALNGVGLAEISFLNIMLKSARVIVLYFFYLIFIEDALSAGFMYQVYSGIVILASLLIIVQEVYFLVFQDVVPFLIPDFPLIGGTSTARYINMWKTNASINWYRPSSLFIEPAHHAQYVLPWIAMTLFGMKRKTGKDWAVLMTVTFAACLTTSSVAIFSCAIIWGFYYITEIGRRKGKLNKQTFLIFFLAFGLGCFLITREGILRQILLRLEEFTVLTSSSTSLRLFRGYACFLNMNVLGKIFGTGYGNIEEYFQQYEVKTAYDEGLTFNTLGYMNGASLLLCSLGIAGIFIYVYAIYPHYKRAKATKGIMLAWFLIMFTSAVLDRPVYFLIMAFLMADSKERESGNGVFL